MTRSQAQAIVTKARPGWRVEDVVEVNDESGPSWEVAMARDGAARTLLVAGDEEVVGERG